MSRVIHIAAAAKQLNRALFNTTPFEGSVMARGERLEVAVHGDWTGSQVQTFAGYDVTWRKAA
jgi:hypothetical protein